MSHRHAPYTSSLYNTHLRLFSTYFEALSSIADHYSQESLHGSPISTGQAQQGIALLLDRLKALMSQRALFSVISLIFCSLWPFNALALELKIIVQQNEVKVPFRHGLMKSRTRTRTAATLRQRTSKQKITLYSTPMTPPKASSKINTSDANTMDNPYKVLRVQVDATQDSMDHAFREAAYSCHPDRYSGDPAKEQRYKYLANCRDQLKDPETRKRIDRALRTNQAVERQKKREVRRDQMLIQSAAERQAERAATRREPPSPAIQRQGAIRGPQPFLRQGPMSVSASQRIQLASAPSSAHSHSNSADPSWYPSRSADPGYRPRLQTTSSHPLGLTGRTQQCQASGAEETTAVAQSTIRAVRGASPVAQYSAAELDDWG